MDACLAHAADDGTRRAKCPARVQIDRQGSSMLPDRWDGLDNREHRGGNGGGDKGGGGTAGWHGVGDKDGRATATAGNAPTLAGPGCSFIVYPPRIPPRNGVGERRDDGSHHDPVEDVTAARKRSISAGSRLTSLGRKGRKMGLDTLKRLTADRKREGEATRGHARDREGEEEEEEERTGAVDWESKSESENESEGESESEREPEAWAESESQSEFKFESEESDDTWRVVTAVAAPAAADPLNNLPLRERMEHVRMSLNMAHLSQRQSMPAACYHINGDASGNAGREKPAKAIPKRKIVESRARVAAVAVAATAAAAAAAESAAAAEAAAAAAALNRRAKAAAATLSRAAAARAAAVAARGKENFIGSVVFDAGTNGTGTIRDFTGLNQDNHKWARVRGPKTEAFSWSAAGQGTGAAGSGKGEEIWDWTTEEVEVPAVAVASAAAASTEERLTRLRRWREALAATRARDPIGTENLTKLGVSRGGIKSP